MEPLVPFKNLSYTQWHNQSKRATWSTDQQAGTSYGGWWINPLPSPIFEGKYICQRIDEILHIKCNFYSVTKCIHLAHGGRNWIRKLKKCNKHTSQSLTPWKKLKWRPCQVVNKQFRLANWIQLFCVKRKEARSAERSQREEGSLSPLPNKSFHFHKLYFFELVHFEANNYLNQFFLHSDSLPAWLCNS